MKVDYSFAPEIHYLCLKDPSARKDLLNEIARRYIDIWLGEPLDKLNIPTEMLATIKKMRLSEFVYRDNKPTEAIREQDLVIGCI